MRVLFISDVYFPRVNDVRFVGYLDRDTSLLDCYAAAAVFVFASRTEAQGLVLLEAMAQGTPVGVRRRCLATAGAFPDASRSEAGTRVYLR